MNYDVLKDYNVKFGYDRLCRILTSLAHILPQDTECRIEPAVYYADDEEELNYANLKWRYSKPSTFTDTELRFDISLTDVLELRWLTISTLHRRKGYATRILNYLIKDCIENNYVLLISDCVEDTTTIMKSLLTDECVTIIQDDRDGPLISFVISTNDNRKLAQTVVDEFIAYHALSPVILQQSDLLCG